MRRVWKYSEHCRFANRECAVIQGLNLRSIIGKSSVIPKPFVNPGISVMSCRHDVLEGLFAVGKTLAPIPPQCPNGSCVECCEGLDTYYALEPVVVPLAYTP